MPFLQEIVEFIGNSIDLVFGMKVCYNYKACVYKLKFSDKTKEDYDE